MPGNNGENRVEILSNFSYGISSVVKSIVNNFVGYVIVPQ
jgi:hypothetical protein